MGKHRTQAKKDKDCAFNIQEIQNTNMDKQSKRTANAAFLRPNSVSKKMQHKDKINHHSKWIKKILDFIEDDGDIEKAIKMSHNIGLVDDHGTHVRLHAEDKEGANDLKKRKRKE